MCGICGIIGIERPERYEAVARRMTATLLHRGPDDEGLLAVPRAALGVRRLSIIDLAGGRQPVWNEDGTLAVVCNGEIYNFQELRRALEAQGHRFRTRSDTEVIVHSYEAWGERCLERLRGMFAFAILEMPEGRSGVARQVFLARDRLGIKPLYYFSADEIFLFASEVRTLVASGIVPAHLSPDALASYLLFGSVAEPMTLVENVFSLAPGHFLKIPVSGSLGAPKPEPYWHFAAPQSPQAGIESGDGMPAAKRLRTRLEEAVRGHLIADVPLGVFLSSGLDSSAVAAIAGRQQSGVHTFTVVFPEEDFSEAEMARRTARRLRTTHQELLISGEEMRVRLDDAVAAFDQPSMDGINTYFVSWAARHAGLKVALSGLGSDELFGGYSTFRNTPRVRRLATIGRWFPASLRAATASVWEGVGRFQRQPDGARKLGAAWLDPEALPHPYFFTRALFTPQKVAALLRQKESSWAASPWAKWLAEAARQADGLDRFAAVSWLESRSYLVNTLLRDTDAMSMSHSLEVRVPFLDHPLVEFAIGLPEAEKRRRGIPKALLVEALEDLLPAEVLAQPKRTFTFPWEKWLPGALREKVSAGLADWSPSLQEVVDGAAVQDVWRDFLEGRTSWSRPWSLYVLNEWARRHLDAAKESGAAPGRAAAITAA